MLEKATSGNMLYVLDFHRFFPHPDLTRLKQRVPEGTEETVDIY